MTHEEMLAALSLILAKLDALEKTAALEELNAELEDAIFCLEESEDDWDDAFSDVSADIADLSREYERIPEAKFAAGMLREITARNT